MRIKKASISVTVIKSGRKRKPDVLRDSKGKSRGEVVDLTPMLNQPHRRRFSKDRQDPKLGYPLGRLARGNYISFEQLNAGNRWASLVRAYALAHGIPTGSAKSPMTDAMGGDGFYRWDDSIDGEERIKRRRELREQYDDCYIALLDTGRHTLAGNSILATCKHVCILEFDESYLWHDRRRLGWLRIGLNALDRVFEIRGQNQGYVVTKAIPIFEVPNE